MDIPVSMLVNVVMIVLLVLTIIYAIMLNERLKKIKDARSELHAITARFLESMQKADSSIETLKSAATQVEGNLYKQIKKAEELQNDLSFFVKRGDDVAAKLEALILAKRTEEDPKKASSQNKITPEAAILKALQEMR